jgi:hypothetical protein
MWELVTDKLKQTMDATEDSLRMAYEVRPKHVGELTNNK